MSTPNAPYGAGETQEWPGERRAEGYVPPQPVGPPPGYPVVVKTKPSVMRIAFGVFLGLLMFSVVWFVAAILAVAVFGSTVRDAVDEVGSSTGSSTDENLQELNDLLEDSANGN